MNKALPDMLFRSPLDIRTQKGVIPLVRTGTIRTVHWYRFDGSCYFFPPFVHYPLFHSHLFVLSIPHFHLHFPIPFHFPFHSIISISFHLFIPFHSLVSFFHSFADVVGPDHSFHSIHSFLPLFHSISIHSIPSGHSGHSFQPFRLHSFFRCIDGQPVDLSLLLAEGLLHPGGRGDLPSWLSWASWGRLVGLQFDLPSSQIRVDRLSVWVRQPAITASLLMAGSDRPWQWR